MISQGPSNALGHSWPGGVWRVDQGLLSRSTGDHLHHHHGQHHHHLWPRPTTAGRRWSLTSSSSPLSSSSPSLSTSSQLDLLPRGAGDNIHHHHCQNHHLRWPRPTIAELKWSFSSSSSSLSTPSTSLTKVYYCGAQVLVTIFIITIIVLVHIFFDQGLLSRGTGDPCQSNHHQGSTNCSILPSYRVF